MRLRLSFEPDRADFFRLAEDDPDPDIRASEIESDRNDLTSRLRWLYDQSALNYAQHLSVDPFTQKPISPDYPSFSFQIDGEETEIILDTDLFEQLCDVYILFGWNGIQQAEKTLRDKQPKADPESGGAIYPRPAPFLVAGYAFFIFTRKILALLIRQALIQVEKKAAEIILANLSVSSIKLTEAYKRYDLKLEKAVLRPATPSRKEKRATVATFRMNNEEAAQRLFKVCSAAAASKKKLEDYFQQVAEGSKKKERVSTSNVPMEMSDAREAAENVAQLKKKIEEEQLLLRDLVVSVRKTDPLILLTIFSLKSPFSRKAFESNTGQIFSSLLSQLDKLGRVVDPQVSKVSELLSWPGADKTNLASFVVPDEGIEKAVIQKAFGANAYALLNENVLLNLLNSDAIPRDSFERVVLVHYLLALTERIAQDEERKKQSEETWATLGKISAAISIASLAFPPLGIVLGGPAILLDLALTAGMAQSTRAGLASFDKQLDDKLMETSPEGNYSDALAQIGTLLNSQKEYRDELAKVISVELLLLLAGAKAGEKSLIRKAFLYRNYYNDVQTLYSE